MPSEGLTRPAEHLKRPTRSIPMLKKQHVRAENKMTATINAKRVRNQLSPVWAAVKGLLIGAAMWTGANTVAQAEEVLFVGTFVGGRTTGSVSVQQENGEYYVQLEADFVHEGAPDPWVAFGADGFRRDALLGELQNLEGRQRYRVPDRLDPTVFNQIYIWCEEYATSLGRAWLKRPE